MPSPVFYLIAALILSIAPVNSASAGNAIVRDGGTLQLGSITYRLDGIDAPPVDQSCIDEHADAWACGTEARDQLAKLIGDRQVRCDDLGADPVFKKRRIGVCKIEGDPTSLSQLIVRNGFALNVGASASGRFKSDEARAREDRQGLWKGCFVAPQDFRRGKTDGSLLGGACRPTAIARSARRCLPRRARCRQAATSRASSRCAPASPAISASITCRDAAAIRG